MLAQILMEELKMFKGDVLFVQGKIEERQEVERMNFENASVFIYNFMQSQELEQAINCREIVLFRSGYTTIMDLAKLEKKAFFIPTPGQYEQEYLAKRLDKKKIVPFSTQETFRIKDLDKIKDYSGLTNF